MVDPPPQRAGIADDGSTGDVDARWLAGVIVHRPSLAFLLLFVVAYVLAAGFAQLLAIVPGTGISVWPPSGLFLATLILAPALSWAWWILGGLLAELFANFIWFNNQFAVAL